MRRNTKRSIAWLAGLATGFQTEFGWWKCSLRVTAKPVAWTSRHIQFFSWITNGVGAKVELGPGKHSIYSHFPKDPNCDVCLKTKITRASWRRRAGTVVPRAKGFGDLISADHKVLSEGIASRSNHRHVVVVQDLATQWLQSYPCTKKTSHETQKSQMKFLEPTRKPKVIFNDDSSEFGKSCKELSWNHCTSTPHTSETNGIADRAVRRVKEGTSAVLLQSGLDNEW